MTYTVYLFALFTFDSLLSPASSVTLYQTKCQCHININTRAVLWQGEPRDVGVNFDNYRILPRHRAVSLLHHGFL